LSLRLAGSDVVLDDLAQVKAVFRPRGFLFPQSLLCGHDPFERHTGRRFLPHRPDHPTFDIRFAIDPIELATLTLPWLHRTIVT
jgi:hypothetical protein